MKDVMNSNIRREQTVWPHFILLPFTCLTLIPAIWVVKMAFRPEQSFDLSLNPWPSVWSLQNFTDLMQADHFSTQIMNSF